jgi:hypothetical protein
MNKSLTSPPVMTEEQKLRVLNSLMWMQVSIYMCDNTEDISWFNARRVKYLSKNLVETIMKDHGHVIKALWDDDGTQMHTVTRVVDDFCQKMKGIEYWKLPEVNYLLDLYIDGKFDHLFLQPSLPQTNEQQPETGV